MRIRAVQFGLGPIGVETVKLATEKPWLEVVGGIDIDPAKKGKSLAELTGLATLQNAPVRGSWEEMLGSQKPDVVFHTSVSKLRPAYEQLRPIIRSGVSAVSSCEELLFPHLGEPALATDLDRECRETGARVLGTGVNPGFVMDVLPLCLTGVCREVKAVHVGRIVNASARRGSLQQKIGSGLPPAEFERRFAEGKAGHAGLQESAALIANCLGWDYSDITEVCRAVVADHHIHTPHVEVQVGQTCGLHQRCELKVNGETRITLDLKMYLDAPDPHDGCQIVGTPPLDLRLAGGVAGDVATIAALVNSAPRVLNARPGLLLMTDLALPVWK